MNYAFISDVHSNARSLELALQYCQQNNLTPIFLGDLFDPKDGEFDTVATYNLVRQAEQHLGAHVLQSNHQNKLIRFLNGNNVVQNYGLNHTINDLFEVQKLDREEIKNWLESFPYGIVLKDDKDIEYRLAHAYFPLSLKINSYNEIDFIHDVSKKDLNKMLYGIFSGKDRINWWETSQQKNWVRVAGHYHHIHMDMQSLVLDGCSGEVGGQLLLYDVNNRFLIRF